MKTIGQQVAQNTKDIAEIKQQQDVAAESWNYNNEELFAKKEGYERKTIKRFFNEMNDESVKNIKFIRPDGTFKVYDISNGSQAYSEFKKDFRECGHDLLLLLD